MNKAKSSKIIPFTSLKSKKSIPVKDMHITGEVLKRFEEVLVKPKLTDEDRKFIKNFDKHLEICESCRKKYATYLRATGKWI